VLGTPDDDAVTEENLFAVTPKRTTAASSASIVNAKPITPDPGPKHAVQSTLKSFFALAPKKRPLAERSTIPPALHAAGPSTARSIAPIKTEPTRNMTQMHLTHLPLLHSCKDCSMSYVRGGEDEALHAKHHVKVIRGIPWDGLGKGKGRATTSDAGWKVVADHLEFGSGREKAKGRVVMCDGSWGGQKVRLAQVPRADRSSPRSSLRSTRCFPRQHSTRQCWIAAKSSST
jgi:N-acetyltransferase